ncbi:unnamed protein product [Nezara viridula]|uniref:Oxidative stress-responsive serine-rich protein 1 n=1 Tax=Nezara viridula TaxID=85310 RepID=A0A9P0H986_NEZVI|nr:unnamed protein product [Nezara viridula]
MSEDLNLPASLQRLEITPERSDCSKFKTNNPFSVPQSENQPECILESLSLKSVCLQGNCDCDKNDNKEDPKALRGIKKSPLRLKPRVLRRQKRNDRILRAPMLKLDSGDRLSTNDISVTSESPVNSKEAAASPSDSCTSRLQGSSRVLLRAPVLRVTPTCSSPLPLTTARWEQQDGGQQPSGQQSRPAAMCAVQARNPSPDDTSIEELASYFDLFVHIPKKMSVMAEMMYI